MSEKNLDSISNWLDSDATQPSTTNDELREYSSEEIADALVIHGLLSDQGLRDEVAESRSLSMIMQRIESELAPEPSAQTEIHPKHSHRRFAVAASFVAIAASVMLVFSLLAPGQNASAAITSLEKVILAAAQPTDRTYSVRVTEEYSASKKPRNLSQEAWEREAKERIDGARLYVRGVNQFVLSTTLESGTTRTSGCDGQVSWAFRQDGPVHVSTNLQRFRGGIPGQQQDLPFLNIHSHLSQLQNGYELELTGQQPTSEKTGELSHLVGVRQSRDVRGPKQIEIWFDASDGTVHRMVLGGLPRGRGGPKSVMLELESQSSLAPNFFSHDAHHEPGKRIRLDDGKL